MYSPNSKYFQIPEIEIIRPSKKALPYTVVPIGDHRALLAWRKEQELMVESRNLRLKPIREARRAVAIDKIANQSAKLELTSEELAEIKYRKLRTEKPKTVEVTPITLSESETPSVSAYVRQFLTYVWRSAFPE